MGTTTIEQELLNYIKSCKTDPKKRNPKRKINYFNVYTFWGKKKKKQP
jgi:hypothetical protein